MTPRFIRFALSAAFALSTPLAAQSLPGVSDEETDIDAGARGLSQVLFGKGDVVFVRTARGRWYRVALNQGCTSGNFSRQDPVSFDTALNNRIDKLTVVRFPRTNRSCSIESIRASEAPPMMDSKSRVPID